MPQCSLGIPEGRGKAPVTLHRDRHPGPEPLLFVLVLAARLDRLGHPVGPAARLDVAGRAARLADRLLRRDRLARILAIGVLLIEREDEPRPVLRRGLLHAFSDPA